MMDVKNFYLNTPLKRYEHLWLKFKDTPKDATKQYALEEKATEDGWVYVEIQKGMYGLPQAGLLAQELMEQQLAKNGYMPSRLFPGLQKYQRRLIQFCLIINDFGIKWIGQENAEHLKLILKETYKITSNWGGTKYVGLTLDWDYKNKEVHTSMLGYVQKCSYTLITANQGNHNINHTPQCPQTIE